MDTTLWQIIKAFWEVIADRDVIRQQLQDAQARLEHLEREAAARDQAIPVDTLTDPVIDPPLPQHLQALWNNNH
jgi:hypothetical protein